MNNSKDAFNRWSKFLNISGGGGEGRKKAKSYKKNLKVIFYDLFYFVVHSRDSVVSYLKNTCLITAASIGSFSNDYDDGNENGKKKQ